MKHQYLVIGKCAPLGGWESWGIEAQSIRSAISKAVHNQVDSDPGKQVSIVAVFVHQDGESLLVAGTIGEVPPSFLPQKMALRRPLRPI